MKRTGKEKSILGRINDLSHRMVLMLVFPIIISLLLMLFYAYKYHSSIQRMETIAGLKTVVAEDIPGAADGRRPYYGNAGKLCRYHKRQY